MFKADKDVLGFKWPRCGFAPSLIIVLCSSGFANPGHAQVAPVSNGQTAVKGAPAKPSKSAQTTNDDDDDADPGVTVTAHKLKPQPGAVIGDIKPELQLSPSDVQSFGVSTVTELLEELAPETRSDRGRGGETPVVLLNGRRISSFNEIQNIPTEAILRVDILPEEVSLKYGYTADQRVVNIVLRRRFRAITGELAGGGATEGDHETGQAEADLLHLRGDSRLNLDLKYQVASNLTDADRNLASNVTGAPYDLAGNVLSTTAGGQIDPALSALVGAPVTVAGAPSSAATGLAPLSAFAATANRPNVTDISRYRTLLPATQQLTANAVLSQPIFWGLNATVNGTLGATSSDALQGLPSTSLLVPSGDPFSPFSQDVLLDRYVDNFGPARQNVTGWTAHLGSTVNRDLGDWRLSLTDAYDHADTQTDTSGGVNKATLQTLLNEDSTSFNPFAPLPNGLFGLLPDSTARSITNGANAQFLANGPLLKVPAGDVYVSAKAGDTGSWIDSTSQRSGLFQATSLSRNDLNAQLNIDLPLTSRTHHILPALGDISVNLNSAVDDLSDFGALKTFGYGVNWTPVTGVNLIVSHTNDHAAPTIQQLGSGVVVTPGFRLFDYATGQTVDVTQVSGGTPNLKADNRNVFKVGLTLKPFASETFTITANYIQSHIDNPIETFPAASAAIESAFPDRFIRDAEGTLVEEDDRPVNFAGQDREELRWGFNYSRPIGPQPQPRFNRRGLGADSAHAHRRPDTSATPIPRYAQPSDTATGATTTGATTTGATAAGGPLDGAPTPPNADVNRPLSSGNGAGRSGGGGRGGGGGGGFGGAVAGGRLQIAVYHTIIFKDQYLVRPGGPVLDILNGAAAGNTGGQPQQEIEAQLGFTLNGLGARLSADWKSGTFVRGATTAASDDLNFSDIGTINLRLFDNLGQQRSILQKFPWLRGARVTLNVVNLFDQRIEVRTASGVTPLSYQSAYLDPAGRAITLSLRKLFY